MSSAFLFLKSKEIVLAAVLMLLGVLFQLFEENIIEPDMLQSWWVTVTHSLGNLFDELRSLVD
ncbi:MAG: hypothetical protein ACE5IR_14715 [bacterium]